MSFIYLSQGFTIYPHRQAIAQGSETIQVRPKTFALLLLLLEKPREVLSKRYLLDTIWDDVAVEEQVLVQSIRELRQIFGNTEIIQTYPRKGYAWSADVEKQNIECPLATAPVKAGRWKKSYTLPAVAAACLLLVCVVFFAVSARSASPQTDVVIVLPLKSHIPGNDYNWVPLGAMDQLIHLLVSDKSAQVMSSEYVFQVMQYARLPRDYETEAVARVFDVSGATLVVEAQFTGSLENFRLDYKLRSRNDVKRGVIFEKQINQAIYKLGQVVVSQTGQKLSNADQNSQAVLSNELMVRGVEQLDKKDYEAALSFFNSLKQLDPNNLTAREQLVRALVAAKKAEQAKEEIAAAIDLAKNTAPQTSARMYLFLALVQLQQQEVDPALVSLQRADEFANISNDILVQSSIASNRAKIHEERDEFSLAQTNFERAIKLDTVIRCSISLSHDHIGLTKLLLKQGKREQALVHFNEAKRLVETHQLDDIRPILDSINFNNLAQMP